MENMTGLIGQTLGQYTIREKVGEGGMASVFKAYQPGLNRDVAIKVLPPHFAKLAGFSERFEREAQAIGNLNHPHILPVHDSGQDKGYSYLVMRYIENASTLTDVMRQKKLSTERIIEIITQIAGALDHAHQKGIIHRDIKPSNVLMDGDWPLLSDFGLAKMAEDPGELTGTGVGIGTPAYMSPEQGMGKKVDHRTDIYALGIILFEMLTGVVPHRAETPIATVMKRVNEPLPMPRSLNPDLSEAVERVLLKALAPDPAQRFDSAGEMAEALKAAFGSQAQAVLPEVSPDYANPKTTPPAPPTATVVEPPAKKMQLGSLSLPLNMLGFSIIGGLILLVLCGLGTLIYFQLQPERSPVTWQYVLDVSQEMAQPFPGEDSSKWEAAQQTLVDNLDTVPGQINVGLRVFGQSDSCTESELLVKPAPDQAALIRAKIEGLAPAGSQSPLSEALVNAFNDLNLAPDKRNALIVLTDGADSCDPEGAAQVAQFMERLNIKIDTYIVGLNIAEPSTAESLRALARASDGIFLAANSSNELRDVLEQIQDNLRAERPPRDIAQAPTATPVPAPTTTPVPEATATPTEVAVAANLSAQEMYDLALAEALNWQADAVLSEIQTTALGPLQADGTSPSWSASFYSEAAGELASVLILNGQMQPLQPVALPQQPNLVAFDETVILDSQRIYDLAAGAGGQAIMAEGFVPAAALVQYPLDESVATWYVNYSDPDTFEVVFTVIIDARSGGVIQALDLR
jgi:serine/threonine-protein kinase